jgi:hypothetical protein
VQARQVVASRFLVLSQHPTGLFYSFDFTNQQFCMPPGKSHLAGYVPDEAGLTGNETALTGTFSEFISCFPDYVEASLVVIGKSAVFF